MNTAQIAAAAIPSALVLSSGIVTLGLRSALRAAVAKGAKVDWRANFTLTPPAAPETIKADMTGFTDALDARIAELRSASQPPVTGVSP